MYWFIQGGVITGLRLLELIGPLILMTSLGSASFEHCVSFRFGLGFSNPFGWFKLDMDARFTFGQSNIFTDEFDQASFRSTLFTMGMCYAF